eukprot:1656466-Prymnesium_polylepis.2
MTPQCVFETRAVGMSDGSGSSQEALLRKEAPSSSFSRSSRLSFSVCSIVTAASAGASTCSLSANEARKPASAVAGRPGSSAAASTPAAG